MAEAPPYLVVARELAKEGFRYIKRYRGVLRLRGVLRCRFGDVPIELRIRDWDFVDFPIIRLLVRPDQLKGVQPHIFASEGLCYYSRGSVVLERFDPLLAVKQCLAQATEVLDQLALDPTYRQEEFTREYLAQWTIGQQPAPWLVIKGTIADRDITASFAILGEERALVGSDISELRAISDAINQPLKEIEGAKVWILRTNHWPSLTVRFPSTAREVLDWLKCWDRVLYKTFVERLRKDRHYLNWPLLCVLIVGPQGWLGVKFDLGATDARKRAKHDRRAYVQNLHTGSRSHWPITRLSVSDWSPQFVHSRNLSFKDLTDKRLTVVGCGAIGSHLAEALVRLGAGQGKAGRLRLVDPESLGAENLGRHALGYPSMTKSKTKEMATELRRLFPTANVIGETKDALSLPDLFADDLLVDATGEEAVSEAINARHKSLTGAVGPVMYVRIYGEGEAVQTLWVEAHGKGACFRCLRLNGPENDRRERFSLSDNEKPRQVWRGCSAVTPYAVSAPMHAAALAADAVSDWLRGNVSPRLRTLVRPGADVKRVKDQNPDSLLGCPACHGSQVEARAA